MDVHKNGVHRKTDLKKGLFICDFEHNGIECKLTFTARKYYKYHRKHHARDMKKLEQIDIYPFQCHLCISSFKKEGFLQKHINQFHEDQNPEPCPICSHVFINGLQVKRHMICAHPESLEANEVCHVCNRKFKFRGSLEKHFINSHTEKTIPCHLCKKGKTMFHSSYKNLKRHLKRKHKLEVPLDFAYPESLETAKPHICHVCDQKFEFQYSLENHLIKIHSC